MRWLHIIPVDASGNNGYSEVEVWATTGPQYSNNGCVNKVVVAQTVPEAVGGFLFMLTYGDFRHDITI